MVEHWTSTMIRLLFQSDKSHELIDITRYLYASILLLIVILKEPIAERSIEKNVARNNNCK